jgi:hypothetical protein
MIWVEEVTIHTNPTKSAPYAGPIYPEPLGLSNHDFTNSDRTVFTLSYFLSRESLSIVSSILICAMAQFLEL